MDKAQLINAVNDGDFDDDLQQIIAACQDRWKAVRIAKVRAANEGDDVRLDNLSPKYLTDYDATLINVKGKKVTVKLDSTAKFGQGYGRYYQDDLQVTVPITSVEIV